MRIDAHQHFWQRERFDYPWMSPDLGPLLHDYGPDELRPLLQPHEIDRTVLVQAISSIEESKWLLGLSHEHDFIAGVVGWVDLTAADVDRQLDELQAAPGKLVGIRHQVHDEIDGQWLLREEVRRGLQAVSHRGLAYDLLIRPQHLDASLKIAQELSDLRLVVDHIGKPCIAADDHWKAWAEGVAALARCPNVWCKLSGMITEADWGSWRNEDLRPYIGHTLKTFSADRLMFGSDWPVCLLAGDYRAAAEAVEFNIAQLSADEQADIFGLSAARFYRLD